MSNIIEQKNQVMESKRDTVASMAIEKLYEVANVLSKSTIIPKDYQGSPANCFVALEMSQRIGASPFMVMQNLYQVNGKPGWGSSFIIATINTSGRFKTPLQFKMEGQGDKQSCVAYATSKDGTYCESPVVSIQMAKDEGWYGKNGSKWRTMPEVMLRYRAASFFGRQYCPELLMGMKTVEELYDIPEGDIQVMTVDQAEVRATKEIAANANTGEVVDIPQTTIQSKETDKPEEDEAW